MTSAAIAATGADFVNLNFYWQTIGAPPPWNPEQVAGPGTTFSTPSIAQIG
jgi:hypothetical protein